MGRARKPLGMQKGNLTVAQQEMMRQAEEIVTVGREDLNTPPSWLSGKTAKDEFQRIIREFEKIDVIGNLDLNNIAAYCNAYAFYRKITKQLNKIPMTVEITSEENEQERIKILNPLYRDLSKNQRDYAEEMRKFAALCGLTIDSRLKIGTVKISKTDQEIVDGFGDI